MKMRQRDAPVVRDIRHRTADVRFFEGGVFGLGQAADSAADELAAPLERPVCGFLCGRAELVHWNPLEICHLVHTTTDYYGTLEEFLPAYGRVDVENYVKLSLGNLFHQLCHHYVHEDQETNAATLPQTYKGVFFLLQNMHYLDTGDFLPTKKALLAALKDPEDRLVLEQAMALTQGADASFPAAFARLFSWCQRKLPSLPLKG